MKARNFIGLLVEQDFSQDIDKFKRFTKVRNNAQNDSVNCLVLLFCEIVNERKILKCRYIICPFFWKLRVWF